MRKLDFNLYLITDRSLFGTLGTFYIAIEEALKAGVKAIQLREKDLTTRELLDMAYKVRELTLKYNARLFINDRVDIALAVNADGVHLPQSSMPAYVVRKILDEHWLFSKASKTPLLGVSTHNINEAKEAEREGADFITFGPIYHTPSKIKYGEPLGIERIKDVCKEVSIPVFGIGGIKPDRVRDVLNSGAYGVGLISGILGQRDIKLAVKEYLEKLV